MNENRSVTNCRICGRQLPAIGTVSKDKLMRRNEKLDSLSLWSIWSDIISLSALLFTFTLTRLHWALHTGQARAVLSSGCVHGLSYTASFAGLSYFESLKQLPEHRICYSFIILILRLYINYASFSQVAEEGSNGCVRLQQQPSRRY